MYPKMMPMKNKKNLSNEKSSVKSPHISQPAIDPIIKPSILFTLYLLKFLLYFFIELRPNVEITFKLNLTNKFLYLEYNSEKNNWNSRILFLTLALE